MDRRRPGVDPVTRGERETSEVQATVDQARRLNVSTPVGQPPAQPVPFRASSPGRVAAPTFTGVGAREGAPLSAVNPAVRQRAQAAVAFHVGGKLPGIEWSRVVSPIADRFLELTAGDPVAVAALEADVNAMFALTDEAIAGRVMRGEPLSQFGDVFDAIAEVSWEIGATDLARRLEAARADSLKGTFDALTEVDALHMSGPAAGPVAPGQVVLPDLARAASFKTLFDAPGAWSFSAESGILAVTVGDQTVGVTARPGFDPENHLDVMAEVVSAQADGRIVGGALTGGQSGGNIQKIIDKAHEVGVWVESNPAARYGVDVLWDGLRKTGAVWIPSRESVEEGRSEEVTPEAIRLASMIPFPEDATIAAIARRIVDANPALSSQTALSQAAETVAENRDQFVSEFEGLTQEQLIEDIEAQVAGESPVGAAVEGALGNVLTGLEWWDSFSQSIGVAVIDTMVDRDAALVEFASGDWQEGFDRVKAMFELPESPTGETIAGIPKTTAADYFDLEGGAADFANITVGTVFDPTNVLLPGAKGVRGLAKQALVDPKYAGVYLRSGQMAHVVDQIAGSTRLSRLSSAAAEVAEEATETVVRESADTLTAKAVRNVAAMSGLGDTEIIDLVRLAQDATSTPEQVRAVLTRGLERDWLGEGPFRAVRHSTVEGIGRSLESIASGAIPAARRAEVMDDMMKLVSKLSVGRTFRLGENQALDNYADLLTQFFPADKDKFTEWFLKGVEARAASGDRAAVVGAAQLQKEQARRAASNTGGAIRSIQQGGDLRSVAGNLRTIEDNLARLDDLGFDDVAKAEVRDQLERTHALMSRRLDDAQPRLAEQRLRQKVAQKQIKQATYLEADVANTQRNNMAAVVAELYDEVAQQINLEAGRDVIPAVKGKMNPLAPDVPVRDWSEVTGVKKILAGDDPDLSLMMGLAVDDVDMARGLDAIGMWNRSQKVTLPASPYEVILYQKLGKDAGLMAQATRIFRNEYLKKASRAMKLAFAVNLLLNPLTAGKITLDETMRFMADTGALGKFFRSTAAGLPGVGGAVESVVTRVKGRFGDAVVNPYGLAFKRNVGGWSADDFADYGWVERPPRRVGPGQMSLAQYRETAERWINGTLLNDRRFREYARWVDTAQVLEDGTKIPPAGFVEWWENGDGLVRPGSADVRKTTVTIRGQALLGDELTATDAFNIIDRSFGHWVDLVVDEGARGSMRRELLSAARGSRGGLDVVKDARLLNAVSQVPGLSGKTGVGSQVFNLFFGAPSGRRAGVFYEHYFDEAMDILTRRHAGRVITAEDVMEAANVDVQTAQFYLRQGADNKIVAQLIGDTGAKTEAQLASKAAQYAERRADDLMYRFTSSSLVGRGVESALLFPFARAQVDFLSWWTDHMTRPMTLPISMEMRAKLPGAVQSAVAGVERVPINLRAWGKYSHLVATTNNEHESPIDQMIDSLTFFPTRFDSEFLLNVSPQFGPLPSWLFDIMVDKGVIDEETEANFEALFPALGFTEYEGDFAEDMFNRVLPNSRRSLRDMSLGMLRGAYALAGEDIHTDPGLLGQIANIIGDGKIPASTGDFQTALVSDLLRVDESGEDVWSLVPGSDEWNTRIREVAVAGAVEANRSEWSQDMRDRVSPLTGYDAEYRALRAYEGMFDDRTFQDLERAGLFQSNDLLIDDDTGQPRIVAVWEKYQAGTATRDELAWLDDRLTTAYFDAGRVEVMPGFSYMDWLNLNNPEVAVNLINKSEDSGVPVRNEEHAEFKRNHINRVTGRLQNVPPGDTGRELISEARRRGWLVSRPVEEWATDAGAAVYKSGQRAIRGVWETVSHRTWQQGLKKAIEDKTFTLGQREARILAAAGLDLEAGTEFTYKEFHETLDVFDERFDIAQPVLIDTLARGAVHGQLARHNDKYGLGLIENLAEAEREFGKLGIESTDDWPEASKVKVRELFGEAISLGYTTLEDYRQEIEPIFGPIDYEPPQPPPVGDLGEGLRLAGDDLASVEVVDGDTLSVMLDDGPLRVRLVGINAPEVTQDGYADARDQLARVVAQADEVVLGVYKPELFGLSQLTAPGERRLLAWLYVDGVPLYSPDVFSADNPRGAGTGGTVLGLQAILEAGR